MVMAARPTLLVVSDVTLGFAVPQISLMARSLARRFDARLVVVEPDMKNRLDLVSIEGAEVRRISTRMPPHDAIYHIEYVRALREIYRELEPEYLLVLNAAVIPPLLLERHQPKRTIYYMLESLDHQIVTGGELFFDINRMVADHVDLVVVPERRRYQIDARRLGWKHLPFVEVLNIGSELRPPAGRPKRCKFLFAGSLNRASGFDWLCDPRLAGVEIDVAGAADSQDARGLVDRFLSTGSGGTRRYLGLIQHQELLERLHDYAYRIVVWKPEDVNTVYASPNKFFESISCGLPSVSTPHPQVVDAVRRFRCALVTPDWSLDGFCRTVADAARLFPTSTYDKLVENCRIAAVEEVNWDRQFAKVADALAALPEPGLRRAS